MKHHNLIKLFVEKDQTLMKSKVQVTSPYYPTSYSLSFLREIHTVGESPCIAFESMVI